MPRIFLGRVATFSLLVLGVYVYARVFVCLRDEKSYRYSFEGYAGSLWRYLESWEIEVAVLYVIKSEG